MEEGKEVNHLTSKKEVYLTILNLMKSGKRPSEIYKILNISKQNLYKYTRTLKDLGFIEKKGYGVWEVKRSKPEDLEHAINWKDKKIRGHAFIWKVKSKKFNWIDILNKLKISYSLVRGYTPRIFINNQKVWLGKESIIIYDNHSFYGQNAIESRKYAVYGLKLILEALQKELMINLGKYYFKPSREHYGMIKNELARQCNDKGEKIKVRDDLDGEWLWIDESEGMLGELETGGKGFTQDRAGLNLDVQNWWNDNKKHNFKVTPSFLMETLTKVAENQVKNELQVQQFTKQIKSHLNLIKSYRTENKKWRKQKEKEILGIKQREQTKLRKWLN